MPQFLSDGSRSRRTAILVYSVCFFVLMSGCGLFRSTKSGYAGEPRRSQIRQGEVVTVAVFQEVGESAAPPVPLGAGALLAAAAIEKSISVVSAELQKHLERLAELHEAAYKGTAIVGAFDPTRPAVIRVSRWVKKDQSDTLGEETARVEYDLIPVAVKNARDVISVVRLRGTPKFTSAASRLARETDPFEVEVVLAFSALGKPSGATPGTAGAAPRAGLAPEYRRVPLTEPIKHSFLASFDPTLSPSLVAPVGYALVGGSALGFFVAPAANPYLLEVQVSVTERDPSRAADRNRRAQQNLREITPDLVNYLQERAGVSPQEAKE